MTGGSAERGGCCRPLADRLLCKGTAGEALGHRLDASSSYRVESGLQLLRQLTGGIFAITKHKYLPRIRFLFACRATPIGTPDQHCSSMSKRGTRRPSSSCTRETISLRWWG